MAGNSNSAPQWVDVFGWSSAVATAATGEITQETLRKCASNGRNVVFLHPDADHCRLPKEGASFIMQCTLSNRQL